MSSQTQIAGYMVGDKYYMSVFKHSAVFYSQDFNSLYVHTLPAEYHDKPALTQLLENHLCLGKVKRIDLVLKKHKDGEIQYGGYSAFIHFVCWFKNENVDYLRNEINNYGICDISGFIYPQTANMGHRFTDVFGNPVYIRFSKNTKPIPEIALNAHQLSEKITVAEQTIVQQQLRLNQLEYQMSRVMDQLANLLARESPVAQVKATLQVDNDPPGFESEYDGDDSTGLYQDSLKKIKINELQSTDSKWPKPVIINSDDNSDWLDYLQQEEKLTMDWSDSLHQDEKWTMDWSDYLHQDEKMTMGDVRHALYSNSAFEPISEIASCSTITTKAIDPNIRELLINTSRY